MLLSDTLSWFRANQSLIFLLKTAWLVKNQQIPISLSLVWPDLGLTPRSTSLQQTYPLLNHKNEEKNLTDRNLDPDLIQAHKWGRIINRLIVSHPSCHTSNRYNIHPKKLMIYVKGQSKKVGIKLNIICICILYENLVVQALDTGR